MRLRRLSPFHLTNALQAIVDAFLLLLAWALAFWLRFNLDVPEEYQYLALVSTPVCVLGYGVGLGVLRVHRQVWDFIGLPDLRQLASGVVLGAVLTTAGILMLRLPHFPRSVLLLHPVLALLLLGAVRAAWRTVIEHPGPGAAGCPSAARCGHPAGRFRRLAGTQRLQPVGAGGDSLASGDRNRPVLPEGSSAGERQRTAGDVPAPACACRAGGQSARISRTARGADAGRGRAHQPAEYAPTRPVAPP